MTNAVNPTVPLVGTVDEFALKVIADPVGASSGTLSHAATNMASPIVAAEAYAVRFLISSNPNSWFRRALSTPTRF
jgi:hypothetical protein